MDDLDLGATIRGFAPHTRVFNRYELRRILGRGGMGVVWLARDEDLDRDVALKFLPDVVALDPASIAELKRETRRNLELTHPHIVRIYDFVQDARSAAISMEYVDGTSLSTLRLERPQSVFPVAEVERLLAQLGDGLAYAHEKARIVHRDLKPANLMVNSRGELKITDFGIATSIADSVSRMSGLNNSSGTAVYMSPQQMMGEKPSVTDDIYALGATVYELLTGKPPFYTGNIILQVTQKTPPAMALRREELGVSGADPIPEHWETAIAACLAKEPAGRPSSVRNFLALLRGEAAISTPASAQATSGAGQPPLAGRTPAQPAASGAAATPGVPASSAAASAAPVLHRSQLPVVAWIAGAAGLAAAAAAFFFWSRGADTPGAPEAKSVAESETKASAGASDSPPASNDASQPAGDVRPGRPDAGPGEPKRVAEPAKPAPASLRLATEPADALVRIGERALPAPVHLTDLPAGPLELVVSRDGYRERRLQFELAAGQALELPVIRLEEILTPVGLSGKQAGLTYTIEGPAGRRYSGTLPDRLELSRGEYTVTVTRAGYGEKRQALTARDQPVQFGADIPGAQLELTSEPAGATVRSGDRELGTTPLRLDDQPPGQLALQISAEHFDPHNLTAELKGGEAWSRQIRLRPDAATLALREMDGYWMAAGMLGALADSAVHVSAAERKLTMPGKALWRKAVLEAKPTEYDTAAGGLAFHGRTPDWEGNFFLAAAGDELLYWLPAAPKQKWRFKRSTEQAYLKVFNSSKPR